MSTILNQKEDVLSVELTKHGRKLLAMGVFQPQYYSFFDDSIIYDSNYAGVIDEDINEIQGRILNQSITFKAYNILEDKLLYPLGKSDTVNDYAPAWDLTVLKGEIAYDQDNSNYYKKIFNIKNINYTISLDKSDRNNFIPIIKDDYLLIDLKELNLSDDMDNFEIELFTYDELSGGKEAGLERKLYFTNKKTNIIDNILFEEDELPSKFFDIELTDSDASYYLDVLVDDEIDSGFINPIEKSVAEIVKSTYSSDYTGPVGPEC